MWALVFRLVTLYLNYQEYPFLDYQTTSSTTHSNENNMSSQNNQQQPSLIGGHAEYIKGAAEVSLVNIDVLEFINMLTTSRLPSVA